MAGVERLISRLSEIAPSSDDFVACDLSLSLAEWFKRQDVKEHIVYLVQHQNYDNTEWVRLGTKTPKPNYAPSTLQKRKDWGLYTNPSKRYMGHEYGDLFRSMDVKVDTEGIMVISDPNGGLGEDFMEGNGNMGTFHEEEGADTHIEQYFEQYDPERNTLTLTDESFALVFGEIREGVIDSMRNQIRNCING